jgi:hypothetical protein
MGRYDKFDVFMRILEIIEKDSASDSLPLASDKPQQVVAFIEQMTVHQRIQGGEEIHMGDQFENIHNSVIATRHSIAKGIIKVRETAGDELANAIKTLEELIASAPDNELDSANKEEALSLLNELTTQASSNSPKVVLKSLGQGLWEILKSAGSIATAVKIAWPVIEQLWH